MEKLLNCAKKLATIAIFLALSTKISAAIVIENTTIELLIPGKISFDKPWVSFSAVEGIPAVFFHPEQSHVLQDLAFRCEQELAERNFDTLDQILGFCMDFVTRYCFDKDRQNVESWFAVPPYCYYESTPVVLLNDYVEQKTGACKQQSLMFLYILAHLMPEAHLYYEKGFVDIRDKTYAHAWTTVSYNHQTRLADPIQRLLFNPEKEQHIIDKIYASNKKIAGSFGI